VISRCALRHGGEALVVDSGSRARATFTRPSAQRRSVRM
jgi:hypothetical protein